ncbi:hypothetical protein F511_23577 [Dorcoceras hygrometricum]|uniref:Uncharacterized protein n=1 Tax=Dorcoceras hygrometricum TaxID=472368 RepID=A0A2Z7AQP5_9LAMI|nr:hypothetical protein F511_23577 [Dorcoceras hygrometricum]
MGYPGQARTKPRTQNSHRNIATGTPDGDRTAAPAARAACDGYSADVRRLQCRRAAAIVPACSGYSACERRSVTLLASRRLAPTKFAGNLALHAGNHDLTPVDFLGSRTPQNPLPMLNTLSSVSMRESRIQYLCDPQWFRDTASRGPKTIVAPESQFRTCPSDHDSIGYPRMSASGESSTTMHRLLHASGSHPIPPPDDPRTNQYNQDLGLIHSTNGNHLESPNEGSSIDHQVTIYLHAQNITMFPTNETWYFASQILVSSSGGLILILTAQSTRNMFRIHSDY